MKNISKLVLAVCVIGSFYCALPLGRQATVSAVAVLPIAANAGPDKTFNAATTGTNVVTTLQGSSTNPNNGTITYLWSCNGGTLSNSNIANPVLTIPYTAQKVSYTCTLRATDSSQMTDTDDMVIFLNNIATLRSIVVTLPASSVSRDRATLNGSLNTSTGSYTVWFQWGSTIQYGLETTRQVATNTVGWSFSQKIASLAPNTTYHFRAVAQNQSTNQITYGSDVTFLASDTQPTTPSTITPSPATPTTPVPSTPTTPTAVSTGITDDLLTDSFFFPLLVLAAASWIFIVRYKRSKEY